jgi:hypothetical protein
VYFLLYIYMNMKMNMNMNMIVNMNMNITDDEHFYVRTQEHVREQGQGHYLH